jgi:hypothetical protein
MTQDTENTHRWQLIRSETSLDLVPKYGTIEHFEGKKCWCSPAMEYGAWIHNEAN